MRNFSWFKTVSAAPLAVYRIGFGLLMLFSTIRFISKGWVQEIYIDPAFHFSYYGFEWLPYPTPSVLYLLFALMILGAVLITLGLFYRFGATLFFLTFTYVELLDKTNYLNHYYFVSLIAFLMIWLPANRYFSLDAKLGRCTASDSVPLWSIRILQFQIAAVYIFAGIAKLETDWLIHAQPLKYWLHTAHHWEYIGNFLKQEWVAYAFAWAGCIYDLTIVLFLSIQKTRKFAYMAVIVFHLMTWLLFPIGVFPWVMMFATTIFFSAHFHEKIIRILKKIIGDTKTPSSVVVSFPSQRLKKVTTAFLGVYIMIQIILPFRYLLYEGDLFWSEQGYRFSWRVMLMEKSGHATFYVKDKKSGIQTEVENRDFLTPNQEKMMSTQPDMILQFAHHLEDVYRDTVITQYGVDMKFEEPEVYAEVYVALNARPHQLMVDKKHNLAAISNDLTERNWLSPYNR
ncbi:MAG: HTTM domain-containing protein [Crocinitomicaceae bacterium]